MGVFHDGRVPRREKELGKGLEVRVEEEVFNPLDVYNSPRVAPDETEHLPAEDVQTTWTDGLLMLDPREPDVIVGFQPGFPHPLLRVLPADDENGNPNVGVEGLQESYRRFPRLYQSRWG